MTQSILYVSIVTIVICFPSTLSKSSFQFDQVRPFPPFDHAAAAWFGEDLDRGGPLQLLHNQPTNHYYNNNYDNYNNNENIIRERGGTALFAAYTVDTEEEEQLDLGEIVRIKCFALIFGVFIHFFGANSHVAKVALVLICTLFACLIHILYPLL